MLTHGVGEIGDWFVSADRVLDDATLASGTAQLQSRAQPGLARSHVDDSHESSRILRGPRTS